MVTLMEGVHQNPRHHNSDMKQVLYWGSTNIRRHCTPGARDLRVAGKDGSVSAARDRGGGTPGLGRNSSLTVKTGSGTLQPPI